MEIFTQNNSRNEGGYDINLDVKLLTGANCLKAMEPQEVISSQGDGP